MTSLNASSIEQKDAIRERLERDMAEHLANGGKVRQVHGFTETKVTLSFWDQNRAAWNRKMATEGGE